VKSVSHTEAKIRRLIEDSRLTGQLSGKLYFAIKWDQKRRSEKRIKCLFACVYYSCYIGLWRITVSGMAATWR